MGNSARRPETTHSRRVQPSYWSMAVPAGAAVAPTPEPAEKGESSAVSDAVSLLMLRANPGESPEGEAAPAAAHESATKAVELGPAEVMTKVEEWSAPPAAASSLRSGPMPAARRRARGGTRAYAGSTPPER